MSATPRSPEAPGSAGAAAVTAVRRATRSEIGSAVTALASAFQDDPVFRWIYAEEFRESSSRTFFAEMLDALAPHDDLWTTGSDGLGAAQWVPYGEEAMSAERGERLGAAMVALPGADLDRMGRLVALVEAHHPVEPHEYLRFLGVVPAAQGRGLGGALMAPVLRRADEAGRPAYLEATSARSKVLYERHGFVASEPFSTGDGPPLWPMWREPRPSSDGSRRAPG